MLLWLLACTSPSAPLARPPVALAGTRWLYEEIDGAEPDAWEFDADGTLFVPTGNNPVNDTWAIDGDALSVKINDYATYEGHRTAQGGYVGTASNTAGKAWTWLLVPDLPPAQDGCGDEGPFDVTETRWQMFDNGSARASDTVFFLGSGRYAYRGDAYNQNNPLRDTWSQRGTDVSWVVNEFATYTGHLVGDHTIVAKVANTNGETWRVRLLREPVPGESTRLYCSKQ